jgi:hypothetical protein
MLAKIIKFRTIDRRDRLSAPIARAFSNNLINRQLASFASKICQDGPACRWRMSPAGRLECQWEITSVDAEAKEPEPSWPIVEMQSLQTIRLFEEGMAAASIC